MLTVERLIAAQKTQFGTAFGASAKLFEGAEKLARLNLQTGRATLEQYADACRAVLTMSDPQQLFALQAAALEPATAKWTGYAGQVYAILAATGAELRQLAEQTASEAQAGVLSAVESALADTPAGGGSAAAMVKSAFGAANTAFESVQGAWRQLGEAADAQVESMTAQASTGRGKRAA